ncbi:hypothetical protein PSCLAVI8L_90095 [Pseudoclavibacter sp. 8L]|nr:hypothetical protein PSCLAVI8L_90095 [Pseudoclavibacter sp. 8L]
MAHPHRGRRRLRGDKRGYGGAASATRYRLPTAAGRPDDRGQTRVVARCQTSSGGRARAGHRRRLRRGPAAHQVSAGPVVHVCGEN